MLSIIIPVLNEAARLSDTLAPLQDLRRAGHEVIVVDGGSSDASVEVARPLTDQVLATPPGRACQMNIGAALAKGDILLFLHADTTLPPSAARLIVEGVASSGRGWGRFDVRLSGSSPLLRMVGGMMNLRSRLTGIATGDQAIFVRRDLFDRVGGYPEQPLMEDIALTGLLRSRERPHCVRVPVVTSSRRWEEDGVIATILLMWRLRAAYFLGADPARLAARYSAR